MVNYFAIEEVPGKQFFVCERMSATVSVPACAAMWREANHQNKERRERCKTCPVGAVHAGETAASMSPLMGSTICARCHRPSRRFINGTICISCYNRQREWIVGKNSRGTAPVRMAQLSRRRLRYICGDEFRELRQEHSIDMTELIVAVLRDSKKKVQFVFQGDTAGFQQGRLF